MLIEKEESLAQVGMLVFNTWGTCYFCSVGQLYPALWDPCGLQHSRISCLSSSPRACSNSCPLSWWCHPTISSSAASFSFCLQSFPASGSFPMSRLFTSGGQSTEASASASVLPMNTQGWFPLGLTLSFRLDLLPVQGALKSLLQHHSLKASMGILTFPRMGKELWVRDRRAVPVFCPECHWGLLFRLYWQYTVSFLYLRSPRSQIQPISDQKNIWGQKFQKVPKNKTWIYYWRLFI